ncbi:hypothetical protein HY004_02685 [Candidatus Saccharibacteria bacterium]|nr:hypothetical protein [Candidatus Saccharibacteria bacterium]
MIEKELAQKKISLAIDQLSEGVRKNYPEHMYEPQRIEIAQQLAIKEYYKLLPFLSSKQFDLLYDQMLEWFVGKNELAPVHDYWNFVGSMTETLKLKSNVFFLTSENVSWKLQTIDVKNFYLYWGVGDLNNKGEKDGSWTYDDVKREVIDDPERFAINKRISDEKSADTLISRDDYPIIALRNLDGTYKLLDGNRRVMRAWLYDVNTLEVWVGEVIREPIIYNHWVSPSFLRRILAEYQISPTQKVKDSTRSQLEIIFKTSTVAKYHFKTRCTHLPGAREISNGLL